MYKYSKQFQNNLIFPKKNKQRIKPHMIKNSSLYKITTKYIWYQV